VKSPAPVDAPAAGPGRRLDPEISDRVLEATLVLLAEDGFARLSIEAVAQRAGVHKPAVYRRWPNKIDLVVAAVKSRTPPPEDPATGNTRDDLITLIRDAARNAQRNPHARAGLRLMAEAATDPELASAVRSRIVGERRAITRAVLERGIATGDLRADLDLDLAIDALFGPLHSRVLVTHRPFTNGDAEQLVDLLLAGIAAPRH
jgi:AcrR family transcriptional regulator